MNAIYTQWSLTPDPININNIKTKRTGVNSRVKTLGMNVPSERGSIRCVWRTSKKVKSYIFVEGGPQAKMTFILCTYIPTYFYLIYESRLRAEITNILVHRDVIHFQEIGETNDSFCLKS